MTVPATMPIIRPPASAIVAMLTEAPSSTMAISRTTVAEKSTPAFKEGARPATV